jgi:pimeloyl-ACP methyl ester carboxylesterase
MTWLQVREALRSEGVPWQTGRGADCLSGWTCGAGPPLYFLNGTGGTYELYVSVVWLLRDTFRCVIYDYPGRGARSPHKAGRAIGNYVDDLFAVADMHGDKRFSLFGSSFGGLVALQALLDQPQRVADAAILGGFACRNLSFCERMLIRAGQHLPGRFRNVPARTKLQIQNHLRWFPPFDRTRWHLFLDDAGSVPLKDLADRAALIRDVDLRSRLQDIQQRVLLIRTEGEGSILATCRTELEAGLPHAESATLHSCGHLPFVTHPHQLAKVIQAFFVEYAEVVPEATSAQR